MSYLFLKKHSIDEWRELTKTTHKARFERLLDQAQSYEDHLPPPEHPSDSITYIGMAVANMSLAYLLSGDERYINTARKWIKVGIGYPSWGKERMPDHDLDAAWLLFGLGLGYDWLKEDLPEDERKALHDKLFLQCNRLYDFAIESEGTWWSSGYWQNHNWICYAGLATAAYALADEHPTEAKLWTDRARENFQIALPLMADDGSDYEGPVYWRYGFMWFPIYTDLELQQSGTDLHNSNFLAKTADFRLHLSAPNLINTANIGDTHDRRSAHSAAINLRLASLYGLGHIQQLTDHFYDTGEWLREGREGLVKPGVLPEAILEFLWYDPTLEHTELKEQPLVMSYPDMGFVATRSSWEIDATYLAFKCGSPTGHKPWMYGQAYNRTNDGWQTISAGHAHPDENGFILIKGEDYLVVDEGYSRTKLSKHHSTILVDGQGQYDEGGYNAFRDLGPEWGGRLESSISLGKTSYMRGEAARVYHPDLGLRQFTRQIVFLDSNLIVIHDTLRANEDRTFSWQLQMDETPEKVTDTSYAIKAGKSSMSIEVFEPKGFQVDIAEEEISANPTSAKPDWIIRSMQYALVLSPAEKTDNTNFLVALNLDDYAVTKIDASRGHVIEATKGDTKLHAAFADAKDGILVSGSIESDATWLSSSNEAGALKSYSAGDVTNVWLEEVLQFCADYPLSVAVEVADSNVKLKIQSAISTYISIRLTSEPTKLLVNGEATDFHYNSDVSLGRIEIPSGESEITIDA